MALDASQKAKIRRYLGYPDSQELENWALEGALTNLSAEGEIEVEEILAAIASINTDLSSSQARQGIVRVEDVEWSRNGGAAAGLLAERARLAREIASILGVPMNTHSGRYQPAGRG